MNNLNAVGNIGSDAELRFLPNATPVAGFSFALTSGFGEKQVTTWLRCSIFGKRAETLAPMLLKGTKIGITGELTNRPYTKDGVEKHSLEVRLNDVTLLGKKEGEAAASPQPVNQPNNSFDSDAPF